MIELTQEQLRNLQMIELEILQEIHRICRKNNISYSLTGGTLLGAVRHGGFIPWDDDADISMLRKEYVKFQKACAQDLDKTRFYFQDVDATKGYRWGYGKVRRKDTLFLREHQEDLKFEQGVFVDVFPRDGVPNGRFMRKVHTFLCFMIRKMMWSPVGAKVSKYRIQRWGYSLLATIPENIVKKCYGHLVHLSNRNDKTELVRALTFPLPNKQQGYKREWYENYTEIEFEHISLMVQGAYKEWLQSEFGNYMELPPEEKRKMHPVSMIRLIEGEK